jgi:hypothetical protein
VNKLWTVERTVLAASACLVLVAASVGAFAARKIARLGAAGEAAVQAPPRTAEAVASIAADGAALCRIADLYPSTPSPEIREAFAAASERLGVRFARAAVAVARDPAAVASGIEPVLADATAAQKAYVGMYGEFMRTVFGPEAASGARETALAAARAQAVFEEALLRLQVAGETARAKWIADAGEGAYEAARDVWVAAAIALGLGSLLVATIVWQVRPIPWWATAGLYDETQQIGVTPDTFTIELVPAPASADVSPVADASPPPASRILPLDDNP